MKVLMIGVDETSIGGMLTVAKNYRNSEAFCRETNLRYLATVIRAGKMRKIIRFLGVLPSIIREITKMPADIVHVHMGERGSVFREGFVVLLAGLLGAKTVIHMHGATIEDWYDRQIFPIQHLVSWIFRRADRMLVLGEYWVPFMVRVMGEDCRKKILVLHNAVKAEENLYEPDAVSILFLGMLVPRKGVEDLLKAFRDILEEIPENINLTLYGDNKEYDIESKIHEYGLEGRAFYRGWLKAEERADCFRRTILNVLPSYNEGLPMTILETMACGIPNLSTKIAAIPEAIEDGLNGRLVNPGDVKELGKAMQEMICDREMRIHFSRNAYGKIKNEFSMEVHLEQLLGIYKALLKEKKRNR